MSLKKETKLNHEVETHWLFGKENVPGTAFRKRIMHIGFCYRKRPITIDFFKNCLAVHSFFLRNFRLYFTSFTK